jgi:hypothetical protein
VTNELPGHSADPPFFRETSDDEPDWVIVMVMLLLLLLELELELELILPVTEVQ